MTVLPVVSLDPVAATLLFVRQQFSVPELAALAIEPELSGRYDQPVSGTEPRMVSQWITSAEPCPHVGQRILIRANKRKPEHLSKAGKWTTHSASYIDGGPQLRRLGAVQGGELVPDRYERGLVIPLPLGCVVGSVTVTADLPIVESTGEHDDEIYSPRYQPEYLLRQQVTGDPYIESNVITTDITDQLLYADWSPGRHAWQLSDPAPVTERCPWCCGAGSDLELDDVEDDTCRVCGGSGSYHPFPLDGRTRTWTP